MGLQVCYLQLTVVALYHNHILLVELEWVQVQVGRGVGKGVRAGVRVVEVVMKEVVNNKPSLRFVTIHACTLSFLYL